MSAEDPRDFEAEQLTYEARHLLIGMIQGAPNYRMVPKPLLSWYGRWRQLEARWEGRPEAKLEIEQDVQTIDFVLNQM